MSDLTQQITGTEMLQYFMNHFRMTAGEAMQSCIDNNQLTIQHSQWVSD